MQWVRTIRGPIQLRLKRTVLALSFLGLFLTGVLLFGRLAASPDAAEHSLLHIVPGALAALLTIVLLQVRVSHRATMRVAYIVFVVAVLIFAIGQLVESVGAFGWVDEEAKYLALTSLHNAIVDAGPYSFFIALMAIPWLIVATVARHRANTGPLLIAFGLGLDILVVLLVVYLAVTGQ